MTDRSRSRMQSLVDLVSQLSTADLDLEDSETLLAHAQATYAQATDRRFFSTPEAHAASFKEHLPALEAAEQQAQQSAQEACSTAQTIRRQVEGTDDPDLSDAELERATKRKLFLQEDVDGRPLPELAAMMRKALLTGDRAEQYLLRRYLPVRLDRLTAQDRAQRGAEDAERELRDGLLRIRASLKDTRTLPLLQRAQELQSRAAKLDRATTRRQEAEQALVGTDGRPRIPWPKSVQAAGPRTGGGQ